MAQAGNNDKRISGRYLIQENDHMAEVLAKDAAKNGGRQSDQAQQGDRQQGTSKRQFNYENPRQVH